MATLSTVDTLEQRATIRLLHYWMSLPRVGKLPGINAFNPQRNSVPWEKCFLVMSGDTSDQAPARIEHVGSGLWSLSESAVPQAFDFADLPEMLQLLIVDLTQALSTLEPIQKQGLCMLKSGKELQYRSILLPFADYEHRPKYGLGAVTVRHAKDK